MSVGLNLVDPNLPLKSVLPDASFTTGGDASVAVAEPTAVGETVTVAGHAHEVDGIGLDADVVRVQASCVSTQVAVAPVSTIGLHAHSVFGVEASEDVERIREPNTVRD